MHDTEPVGANSFAAQTKRVTTRLMPLALWGITFGTAAFDHDNVSPYACEWSVGHSPQPLPGTDDAEPSLFMESKAGAVLWEYAGLDGPNAGSLSGID